MRFRTYPKIGATAEPIGGPWVATEKLHGANFVIGVVGGEVSFGKRKAWLSPDDDFFGWQILARELEAPVRELARALGTPQVVAFGELIGGAYPHPDVPVVPGLSAVQTGVWYAPDLRWAMFDVLVASGDDDDGELLAFDELRSLADEVGLSVPPVLGCCRLADLDRIPIAAPTAMPARFGLPPIDGNLREGFVAKPARRLPYNARPIVKRKLPDFDDARFDDGAPWDPGHLTVDELVAWAVRLVNPARVASARSKVGVAPSAIVDEIVLDVAVDLETVFRAAWRDLGAVGEATVLDVVRAAAMALVRQVPELR